MRKLPVVLIAAVIAAACGDSSTGPDLASSAGNYAMRSINGALLPFTLLTTADVKLEITSDTLYLTTNGHFADIGHYRRTTLGVVDFPADTLAGDWTIRGTTLSMTSPQGTFTGNLVGNTLTIEGAGISSVYTK